MIISFVVSMVGSYLWSLIIKKSEDKSVHKNENYNACIRD